MHEDEELKLMCQRLFGQANQCWHRKPKQCCGATTKRTGLPCRAMALDNGRCKYHGGLSTGPKTPEGKARALANLKQYRGKETA